MPQDYCSPTWRRQLLSSPDDYPSWDALVLRKLKPDPVKAVMPVLARQPLSPCKLLPHRQRRGENR